MKEKYEAVIALSKNWKAETHKALRDGSKTSIGIDDLHPESMMVAIAGAYALMNGMTDRLIICGGQTAGLRYPPESLMMAEYIQQLFPNLPGKLLLDFSSINTWENAWMAKIIADDEGLNLEKLALTTVSMHLPRARRIFNDNGIPIKRADAYTTEGLLLGYGESIGETERWVRIIRKYHRSKELALRRPPELITSAITHSGIDPKGMIIGGITQMMPTRRGYDRSNR